MVITLNLDVVENIYRKPMLIRLKFLCWWIESISQTCVACISIDIGWTNLPRLMTFSALLACADVSSRTGWVAFGLSGSCSNPWSETSTHVNDIFWGRKMEHAWHCLWCFFSQKRLETDQLSQLRCWKKKGYYFDVSFDSLASTVKRTSWPAVVRSPRMLL